MEYEAAFERMNDAAIRAWDSYEEDLADYWQEYGEEYGGGCGRPRMG